MALHVSALLRIIFKREVKAITIKENTRNNYHSFIKYEILYNNEDKSKIGSSIYLIHALLVCLITFKTLNGIAMAT